MADRLQHQLAWWRFYRECLRYATTGAWGVVGDLSTGLPLAALVVKKMLPHWYGVAAKFLEAHGINDDWMLLAPAAAGGLILLARLITAPFVLYRDKPSESQLDAHDPHAVVERFRILAGRLRLLVAERNESPPPPDYQELKRRQFEAVMGTFEPGLRNRGQYEEQQRQRRLDAAVMDRYGREFAQLVMSAARDAARLGIAASATKTLESYPSSVSQIEARAVALDAIAGEMERAESAHAAAHILRRHLAPDDAGAVIRLVSSALTNYLKDLETRTSAYPETNTAVEAARLRQILVASIGTDVETLEYRDELAKTLADAGMETFLDEWAAGRPEFEKYNDPRSLVLLDGEPKSSMREHVLTALRNVGVSVREADVDWKYLPTRGRIHSGKQLTLIVGRLR